MISEFISSASAYGEASRMLFKPWASRYVIFSAFLSFVTFLALAILIFLYGDNMMIWLLAKISPGVLEMNWLSTVLEWLARILIFLLLVFIYKYIVLIITSPVMSILSEKVEARLTGQPVPALGIGGQLKSVVRGSVIALGNLARELLITIPLLLLSLVPGLALGTTPVLLLTQAYFAGYGNLDFFMERRFGVRDTRRFIRSHKGLAAGNGLIYLGFLFVPVLGVLFAPALATIAATIAGLDTIKNDDLSASPEFPSRKA